MTYSICFPAQARIENYDVDYQGEKYEAVVVWSEERGLENQKSIEEEKRLLRYAESWLINYYIERGIIEPGDSLSQELAEIERFDSRGSAVLIFKKKADGTSELVSMMRFVRPSAEKPVLPGFERLISQFVKVHPEVPAEVWKDKIFSSLRDKPVMSDSEYQRFRLPGVDGKEVRLSEVEKRDHGFEQFRGGAIEIKSTAVKNGVGTHLLPLMFFIAEESGISLAGYRDFAELGSFTLGEHRLMGEEFAEGKGLSPEEREQRFYRLPVAYMIETYHDRLFGSLGFKLLDFVNSLKSLVGVPNDGSKYMWISRENFVEITGEVMLTRKAYSKSGQALIRKSQISVATTMTKLKQLIKAPRCQQTFSSR